MIHLIEHNQLDISLKQQFITLSKTSRYIETFNIFPYTGLVHYLVVSDKKIIGYVFIGKTQYATHTIIIELLKDTVEYENILQLAQTKYSKYNTCKLTILKKKDDLDDLDNNIQFKTVKINNKNYKIHVTRTRKATSIRTSGTYIISARKLDSLVFTSLEEHLNKFGYYETKNPNSRPLLLWMEILENYKFDTKYFKTHPWIMNVLADSKSYISNKSNLYNNFYNAYPTECLQYMAETWNFKTNPYQFLTRIKQQKEVFIVRPAGTGAFSGKDIVVVYNEHTFNEAVQHTKNYNNVIISKYITDPLLFNNRKFHLRTYLLVCSLNDSKSGSRYMTKFLNFYELYHALKPYKNIDYSNHDIHDTHFGSTERDFICPADLPSDLQKKMNDIIYPKMRECMLLISKMFRPYARPYPEAKNAFELFGCDFLIRDNNEVVLMEINDRIGFKKYSYEKRQQFSKLLLDVIYKGLLLPHITNSHPKYKTPDNFWLYEN